MVFYEDLWPSMKTFVIFLNRFPEYPKTSMHDVKVDIDCLKELYKIYNENGKEETGKDN